MNNILSFLRPPSSIECSTTTAAAGGKSCEDTYYEFNRCLNKSRGNVSKCVQLESDLRKCETSLHFKKSNNNSRNSYCIEETLDLLKCSHNPTKQGGSLCANQFIALRECNRPRGPMLSLSTSTISGGGNNKSQSAVISYMPNDSRSNEFIESASDILFSNQQNNVISKQTVIDYAKSIGISDVEQIHF